MPTKQENDADTNVFAFKDHSRFSQEVKVLAEVEKIWILYDLDGNSTLDFDEIKQYLELRAFPHLSLKKEDLDLIWAKIDIDGDGLVNKEEMAIFVHRLLHENGNIIKFKAPERKIIFKRMQY